MHWQQCITSTQHTRPHPHAAIIAAVLTNTLATLCKSCACICQAMTSNSSDNATYCRYTVQTATIHHRHPARKLPVQAAIIFARHSCALITLCKSSSCLCQACQVKHLVVEVPAAFPKHGRSRFFSSVDFPSSSQWHPTITAWPAAFQHWPASLLPSAARFAPVRCRSKLSSWLLPSAPAAAVTCCRSRCLTCAPILHRTAPLLDRAHRHQLWVDHSARLPETHWDATVTDASLRGALSCAPAALPHAIMWAGAAGWSSPQLWRRYGARCSWCSWGRRRGPVQPGTLWARVR